MQSRLLCSVEQIIMNVNFAQVEREMPKKQRQARLWEAVHDSRFARKLQKFHPSGMFSQGALVTAPPIRMQFRTAFMSAPPIPHAAFLRCRIAPLRSTRCSPANRLPALCWYDPGLLREVPVVQHSVQLSNQFLPQSESKSLFFVWSSNLS